MTARNNLHWYRVTLTLNPDTADAKLVHITLEAGNEEYAGREAAATYNGSGLRKACPVRIDKVELDAVVPWKGR